jgi:hypothetical protein
MGGPRQNLGEAATGWIAPALVEPERVLVLLVESDGAFRSLDVIGVAHLPTGRDAAGIDRAEHAALETADDLRVIVVGDRLRSCGAEPCPVHGLDLCDERFDWPHERYCGVERMRRKVIHIAGCAPARAPVGAGGRIGEEVLGVLAAEVRDPADLARCHDLTRKLRSGRANEIVTDHVDAAALLRRHRHLAALGEALAERLLAQDWLAEGKGGERDVRCVHCGLAITTASTSGASTRARQSAVPRRNPKAHAFSCASDSLIAESISSDGRCAVSKTAATALIATA